MGSVGQAQRPLRRGTRTPAADPFAGIGKPEPLKCHLPGAWSRRIDEEHRLVYIVTDEEIIILAARYHC